MQLSPHERIVHFSTMLKSLRLVISVTTDEKDLRVLENARCFLLWEMGRERRRSRPIVWRGHATTRQTEKALLEAVARQIESDEVPVVVGESNPHKRRRLDDPFHEMILIGSLFDNDRKCYTCKRRVEFLFANHTWLSSESRSKRRDLLSTAVKQEPGSRLFYLCEWCARSAVEHNWSLHTVWLYSGAITVDEKWQSVERSGDWKHTCFFRAAESNGGVTAVTQILYHDAGDRWSCWSVNERGCCSKPSIGAFPGGSREAKKKWVKATDAVFDHV